jgi:hypothetical protein
VTACPLGGGQQRQHVAFVEACEGIQERDYRLAMIVGTGDWVKEFPDGVERLDRTKATTVVSFLEKTICRQQAIEEAC